MSEVPLQGKGVKALPPPRSRVCQTGFGWGGWGDLRHANVSGKGQLVRERVHRFQLLQCVRPLLLETPTPADYSVVLSFRSALCEGQGGLSGEITLPRNCVTSVRRSFPLPPKRLGIRRTYGQNSQVPQLLANQGDSWYKTCSRGSLISPTSTFSSRECHDGRPTWEDIVGR